MTTRTLDRPPATLPTMLRAALPAVPGVSRLPGVRRTGTTLPRLTLARHDVPVEPAHVAAYAEVCGFPLRDTLPLTYPHVLAFGLHMALMTDAEFPFPAIGTVHLENCVTQHRPVTTDERLQLTVRADALRAHPKGAVFDILTEVHSAGELVWEETSTFLRRGTAPAEPGSPRPDLDLEPVATTGVRWQLPGDLGRRYAAVSGDHNPIHLYGLTAKAFGFPRQIAHGMWSKARCVAMLEPRLPDAVRVEVAFRKPLLLPGSVAFGSRRVDVPVDSPGDSPVDSPVDSPGAGQGDWAFSLTAPRTGAVHLLGRTTAL